MILLNFMFNVIYNDMQASEANGHLIKYADHITPIIPSRFNAPEKTWAALLELTSWCESNNMTFNEFKSVGHCVLFPLSLQVLPLLDMRQCSI